MKKQYLLAGALLALAIQAPVFAGVENEYTPATPPPTDPGPGFDWCSGWGMGAQVGTQGVGLHFRYNLNPEFYFRLEGNLLGYKDDWDVEDVNYEGDLDFNNLGLTANWLPFAGSGFRVTAGAYFSENSALGRTRSGVVDINGNPYTVDANNSISAKVEYDQFNPYIGIGWDWAFGSERQFIFGVDLGVSYFGDPSVSVTATGAINNIPGFQNDLAAYTNDVEDAAENLRWYPVVKLSFTWMF